MKENRRIAMPTNLFFGPSRTLRLAEHAAAAPEHHLSFTEQRDGRTCPGALEWVANWGTYLMSGDRPGLLVEPDDPTSANVVVYAKGWAPESNRRARADTDVGGDDFVEHPHITEAPPGEPSPARPAPQRRRHPATATSCGASPATGSAYEVSRTAPTDR